MSLFRIEIDAEGNRIEIAQVAYQTRDGVRVLDASESAPDGWVEFTPGPEPITREQIANRRYRAEIAGITLNGLLINTEDRSKLLINGAALEAFMDPSYTMQWKTEAGFVQLSAPQVIGIASAVRSHVQACFDREAELLAALDAGTLTSDMLEHGWP